MKDMKRPPSYLKPHLHFTKEVGKVLEVEKLDNGAYNVRGTEGFTTYLGSDIVEVFKEKPKKDYCDD